jgi:glycosyltransferase involved in cell wall biosynthesis
LAPSSKTNGAKKAMRKITVILCTYNRCQSLGKALEGIAAQQVPESVDWEVIVVDNNSPDSTRAVVEEIRQRFPGRFRYVFETQQGLSWARNAGIREAHGEILAFTDDDLRVEPDWLQNLTFHLHSGEWAGAGGRVVPANVFARPRWLPLEGPYNMGGVLALFDLGGEARELDRPPFGANMAFRREVFERYGAFRTDLGRKPGSLLSGEDTDMGQRLIAAGEHLRYEPSSVVYHDVPDERLKKEYFLRFWFEHGRTPIWTGQKRTSFCGIPWRYVRALGMSGRLAARTLHWMVTVSPERRFHRKAFVWMTAGRVVEIYKSAGNEKPQVIAMQKTKPDCNASDATS